MRIFLAKQHRTTHALLSHSPALHPRGCADAEGVAWDVQMQGTTRSWQTISALLGAVFPSDCCGFTYQIGIVFIQIWPS